MAFWPSSKPEASIPYTEFLTQVRNGNVKQVHIDGSQITGSLVKPLAWPAPTATPAATTAATTATAQPNPNAQASKNYSSFATYFPESVGDASLLPLLEEHSVVVDVAPPPSPWFSLLISMGLPLLLLVLFFVWMAWMGRQNQAGIFKFGRTSARKYGAQHYPAVTFEDVAGADEAKEELQEVVDFLRRPEKYHMIGARIPRGVLLIGPPGTGKTLLARAVAGEAGVPFFNISASEFVEMFVGVGASRVRDLFKQAKEAAPAIVFIDELDAVGRRRGAGVGTVNDEREQTLNQLLVEMDGFDEHHEVIVLAATNRPDVLDPALQRPGRFDRQVEVAMPDRRGREGILQIHTRGLRLGPDVDLEVLAQTTIGFNGANLANLCNEAAINAARHNHTQVLQSDFEEAMDKLVLGGKRPILLNERERKVVAYHESGHALVAWFVPEADPVHKVTIVPHGRALGVTEQLPGEDHYNFSRNYLLARVAVMLGGRGAEETVFGEITTGAENDLVEATGLVRRMITRWGMGDLGLAAYKADEEHPFLGYELSQGRDYSEATAALVDKNVQRILKERYDAVQELLILHREGLDRLVEALLQDETVVQDDLVRILGDRTAAPMPIERAESFAPDRATPEPVSLNHPDAA